MNNSSENDIVNIIFDNGWIIIDFILLNVICFITYN